MLENFQIDLLIGVSGIICITVSHYFAERLFLWDMCSIYSDLNLVKKIIKGEASFIFYGVPFLFYILLEAIAIFIFSDKLSITDIIFTGLFPQLGVYVYILFLQMRLYFMRLRNTIHINKTDTVDSSNYQEGNIYTIERVKKLDFCPPSPPEFGEPRFKSPQIGELRDKKLALLAKNSFVGNSPTPSDDDLNYFKEFFKFLISIEYILGTILLITGGLLGKFSHTLYNLL
jgi:hypothetical protein